METSKKLTWVMTIFFIFAVIGIGLTDALLKTNLSYLLDYIMPLETTVMVAYFGKSGVENFQKIKSSDSTSIDQTK
jgi:hypothetical protein